MGRPKGAKNKKGRIALITKKCPTCSILFLINRSLKHVKNCSWYCRNKELSKKYRGKGNPFYGKTFKHTEYTKKWKIGKGGITPQTKLLRKSVEYIKWRSKVFERDKYTCRNCGKKGVKLNAHHIKSFAKYPNLRLVLKNGLTLCIPCHKKTDNFKNGK